MFSVTHFQVICDKQSFVSALYKKTGRTDVVRPEASDSLERTLCHDPDRPVPRFRVVVWVNEDIIRSVFLLIVPDTHPCGDTHSLLNDGVFEHRAGSDLCSVKYNHPDKISSLIDAD
jgi:hypothetical protein